MKKMAEKFGTQAAAMQVIGNSHGLKGKYATSWVRRRVGCPRGWIWPRTVTAR